MKKNVVKPIRHTHLSKIQTVLCYIIGVLSATLIVMCGIYLHLKKNPDIMTVSAHEPVVFDDNEAVRFGNYSMNIEQFILYAVDAVPSYLSKYGDDVWNKKEVDIGWAKADPYSSCALYVTDIILSAISCDVYYSSKYGDLNDNIVAICDEAAAERYGKVLDTEAKKLMTLDALKEYEYSMYRLSYIYNEITEECGDDPAAIQEALGGLRNAIDKDFDYNICINWDLVSQIDFSANSTQ